MELGASLDFASIKMTLDASLEVCGSGDKGIAYHKDDHKVIKLHPKWDEPYIKFIKWVRTLKYTDYSQYFPTVFDIDERSDCVLVTMEKLTPFNDLTGEEICKVTPSFSPNADSIEAAISEFTNRLIHKVDLNLKRAYIRPKYSKYQTSAGLEKAIAALMDNVFIPGFAVDLNNDNIMYRRKNGDIVPVLIDPFT